MSCEYCHEDRDGCVLCLDHRGHLWFEYPNKLVLQFDKRRSEFEIRFCPMCGRALKKEYTDPYCLTDMRKESDGNV